MSTGITPGEKLAEWAKAKHRGEDASVLMDEFEILSCEFFAKPGTTVTVGKHRSVDGGVIKKFKE